MKPSDNVDMGSILDNLKKETSHGTHGRCPQAPRRNLGRIRAAIATDGMGRQWSQALQESRVPPRHSVCAGYGNSVGDDAQRVPLVQDMLEPFQKVAWPRRFPRGLAHTGRTIRISPRNQLGPDMPRRVKTPIKKRGEETGPSPVDRGKSGTNIHLATDGRGMPLGAVITGANTNDGKQAEDVLDSLVIKPPTPEHRPESPDARDLPSARGDGAYGNEPTRQRTACSGFRMCAPRRGQTKLPGIGRIRSAVERGHAFLSQFGRIARRLDRIALRYPGWVQLAACVIFIRAGFFR